MRKRGTLSEKDLKEFRRAFERAIKKVERQHPGSIALLQSVPRDALRRGIKEVLEARIVAEGLR